MKREMRKRRLFQLKFEWRRRAVWAAGLMALAMALLWSAVFFILAESRTATDSNANESVRALVATLQQQVLRKVSQMDALTQITKFQYQKSAGAFDVQTDLPEGLLAHDAALQVTIVGEDGHIEQSSSRRGVGLDISDREHFRIHKVNADVGLFIGHPVIGGVSGERSIQLSRRLSHPDGHFAGVVVVSVNPDFFTEGAYSEPELGRGGLVALVKGGAGYVLSARESTGAVTFPADRLPRISDIHSAARAVPGSAADHDAPYFEAAAPVPGYPLYVVASRLRSEVSASYAMKRSLYLWVAVLVSIALAVFFVVMFVVLQDGWARSRTDFLTGLPNGRMATELLRVAVSRRTAPGRLVVLYVDIDHLARINEHFGHDVGDDCLVLIARRLADWIKGKGSAARMCGDEFVLMLQLDQVASASEDLAASIRHIFSLPFRVGTNSHFLTASIGMAIFDGVIGTARDLLSKAHLAMRVAQTMPADGSPVRFEVFSAALEDRIADEAMLDREVRRGLEENEFFVMYQPIVDLAGRDLVSWEALIRWRHPVRGLISPDVFIPLAEKKGSIVPITDFVINAVCQQLADLSNGGKPAPVSINISPVVLAIGYLPESIGHYLKLHDIPAELVEIEITETAMFELSKQMDQQLWRLRAMGIKIILDDFGTGFSSLTHLWKLPLDGVKIDRSFIHGLTESERPGAIVRSIVKVAHEFGFTVVAECVETGEQAKWLSQFERVRAQGFLFSKPMFKPFPGQWRGVVQDDDLRGVGALD